MNGPRHEQEFVDQSPYPYIADLALRFRLEKVDTLLQGKEGERIPLQEARSEVGRLLNFSPEIPRIVSNALLKGGISIEGIQPENSGGITRYYMDPDALRAFIAVCDGVEKWKLRRPRINWGEILKDTNEALGEAAFSALIHQPNSRRHNGGAAEAPAVESDNSIPDQVQAEKSDAVAKKGRLQGFTPFFYQNEIEKATAEWSDTRMERLMESVKNILPHEEIEVYRSEPWYMPTQMVLFIQYVLKNIQEEGKEEEFQPAKGYIKLKSSALYDAMSYCLDFLKKYPNFKGNLVRLFRAAENQGLKMGMKKRTTSLTRSIFQTSYIKNTRFLRFYSLIALLKEALPPEA